MTDRLKSLKKTSSGRPGLPLIFKSILMGLFAFGIIGVLEYAFTLRLLAGYPPVIHVIVDMLIILVVLIAFGLILARKAQRIKDSQSPILKAFDFMPAGVTICKPCDGGEDFIITGMNKAGIEMSRVNYQETIGRRFSEVFPNVKNNGLLAIAQKVWRTGSGQTINDNFYDDAIRHGYFNVEMYKTDDDSLIILYNDVSESKRMRGLMDQTELFAGMGSWEWEVATNQVIWSDNLYPIFGLDPDKYSPLDRDGMNSILDGEEAAMHDRAVTQAVTQGTPYQMKLHLNKTRDGVKKVLYVEAVVEKDDAGKTLRLRGMVQDITTKEAVAKELHQNRNLLEQTGKLSRTGGWEVDLKTDRVYWTQSTFDIHNLDSGATNDRPVADAIKYYPQPDRERLQAALDQLTRHGTPFDLKLAFIDAREQHLTVHVLGQAEKTNGKVTRIFGAIQDITEKEASEQALIKSEQFLEQTGRLSRVGGWEIDIPSGKANWTQMVSEIYGVADDPDFEITAEKGITFYPEPGRTTLQEHLDRLIEQGTPYDLKLPFINAKEHHLTVRALGFAEKTDGKVTRIYGAFQDVTNQQKIEDERIELLDQMKTAQRLESIGLFSGGIAHDFNNILQVIMINVELATALSQNGEVIQTLEEISKSALTASGVCDQMLTYAGKKEIKSSPISLNRTIEETRKLLNSSISHSCTLDFDLRAKPDVFLGNVSSLKQVIMNLAINASEACKDLSHDGYTGCIEIKSDTTELDEDLASRLTPSIQGPTGSFIHLEISDNGHGMQAEEVHKIFDPFFTTKFHGRGLGLSSVLGIVTSFCGGIRVESTPGQGTSFHIYLPVHTTEKLDQASNIKPTLAEKPQTILRKTVLIIDDEASILRGLSLSLQKMNYLPLTADNGEAGFELFKANQKKISCVLLDLTMPGWNGAKTLRHIRKINQHVPVIIMSGYDMDDASIEFSRDDISGYMHKPFQLATMTEMLHSVVQQYQPKP
jgi:signal transduction histidine kinase/ActR/RegA family two-component response regulator